MAGKSIENLILEASEKAIKNAGGGKVDLGIKLYYGGFSTKVEFYVDDGVFCGQLIGVKPLVLFEGETVSNFKKAFYHTVDSHIESG